MEIKNENNLKLGICSKVLIIATTIFYAVSFINTNFNLIYGNITLFSFNWMEVYRIITGIFISNNIFDLILNYYTIITVLNFYENIEGTTKFSIKLFVNLFLLQILFLGFFLTFAYIFPIILSFMIKPIPAIGIVFLTKHILLTEDKNIQIYPNFKCSDRWLLIFSLAFYIIFNLAEPKIEIFICLYYGFLMCKFPKYFDYSLNEEIILHFEKNENLKFIYSLDGWIAVEECFFNKNKCVHDDSLRENPTEDIKEIIENIEVVDLSDHANDSNLFVKNKDKEDLYFNLNI